MRDETIQSYRDCERLLQFSIAINKNYGDFEYSVIDALSEYFNLHLTSYTIIDHATDGTPVIQKNISRTIDESIMERYKNELYKTDIFIRHFDRYRFQAVSDNVYTSQNFPDSTFRESEYGKFLAATNIGYQAVLGLKNTASPPGHTISIYKPLDSDGFTDRELGLYKQIGAIFNSAVTRYKNYLRQQLIIDVSNHFMDNFEIGYALLDQYNTILNYNEAFLAFSSQFSEAVELPAIIDDIIKKVNVQSEKSDTSAKFKEYEMDGCILSVIKKKYPTANAGMKRFTLLTIRNKMPQISVSDENMRMLLTGEYNLTSREAETLLLMAKGHDNNEIAGMLYISMSTVKSHIRSIYAKIGVSTRAELLRKIRPFLQQ